MVCDGEIRQYIIWVLLDVLPIPFFYIFYFFRVPYIIEKEREKMKEGRGLEGMALGTAH